MYIINILSHNRRIDVDENAVLSDAIKKAGIQLTAYCNGKGVCGKCLVEIIEGDRPPLNDHEKELKPVKANENLRLSCLYRVRSDLTIHIPEESYIENTYYAEHTEDAAINKEHTLGIAVDIGTTTIASALVDLVTGGILSKVRSLNEQSQYGADIITRIAYALENTENCRILRETLVQTIQNHFDRLISETEVDTAKIAKLVFAGNTVMNHILAGLSLKSLGYAPFREEKRVFEALPATDYGFENIHGAEVIIAPNIESYIGGDISAGLIHVSFFKENQNVLFIDLGTNGELVIRKDDRIVAASTAIGPAFEGRNISCGMQALPGAIYKAGGEDTLTVYTIDDVPPVGICGSGLIDVIAYFMRKGMINSMGRFEGDNDHLPVTDGIGITPRDMNEILLALGAVKTGVKLLLKHLDLSLDDLDKVLIAGSFGKHLNVDNAMETGLIPPLAKEKIKVIGNSSLGGAVDILKMDHNVSHLWDDLGKIEHVSLSKEPGFREEFVESIMLGNEYYEPGCGLR